MTLPAPRPGPDDAAFWEGCTRGELLIQRCKACAALRFWNLPMCASCNSLESEAVKACGKGRIWSYTTTHQAFSPAWKELLPYTVVVVELHEGPRMTSALVSTPANVSIGQQVEVVFVEQSGTSLPKFKVV